jgi:hypothetical protein
MDKKLDLWAMYLIVLLVAAYAHHELEAHFFPDSSIKAYMESFDASKH